MHDARTCTADIKHPVWCKHVDDDAPLAAGEFVLLAPAEPEGEHEGRSFTLDAGNTLAYSVTVTPVQWFGDDPTTEQTSTVRIDTMNHELVGAGQSVYLNVNEVDKLILMLQRAAQIL